MKNILLKSAVLTFIFAVLASSSIATKRRLDDEILDSKRFRISKYIQPRSTEESIKEVKRMIFDGIPLMTISSYLGRQEIGCMQRVSKNISRFFTQREEALQLWRGYAQRLKLKIGHDIRLRALMNQIRDYYKPQIHLLIDDTDERFEDIRIFCSNFNGSAIAGLAEDAQNNNRITAVIWKDGKIQALDMLNGGDQNEAAAISEDGTVIAGWAEDGQNNNRLTSVIWKDGKIQALDMLNNGLWSMATVISADGKIIAGWARDGQDNDKSTAVIWKDGKIQALDMLNNGRRSIARIISADGKIIAGWAEDGRDNNDKSTAVIWKDEKIQALDMLNNGLWSEVAAISKDGTVIAGCARDGQDNNRIRAVIWKDGKIQALDMLNNGFWSEVAAISEDGTVIAGWAEDGQNDRNLEDSQNDQSLTAVIWNEQGIVSLNDYPFKQLHDRLVKTTAVFSNGSGFIVQSDTNKIYKAHVPRHDLWKMS